MTADRATEPRMVLVNEQHSLGLSPVIASIKPTPQEPCGPPICHWVGVVADPVQEQFPSATNVRDPVRAVTTL